MNILWRRQAENELNAAFDYIEEHNPQAARRIYRTIRRRVGQLATFPGLGRAGRVQDTRELPIPGTPYLVAYTVDIRANAVIVLRVLHGAQQYPEEAE